MNVYISSADIMNRNMDKRFGASFLITDEILYCEDKVNYAYEYDGCNTRAKYLFQMGDMLISHLSV